jgi:hypothetical protein
MWSQAPVLTALGFELAIIVNGASAGLQGTDETFSSIGVGMTDVARVGVKFDPATQVGQWQDLTASTSSSVFFILQIPNGSGAIIDLVADFVMQPLAAPILQTVTTGPAIPGQLYYMALDNTAGGTGSTNAVLRPGTEVQFIS